MNQKINIYPSNMSEWLSLVVDAQSKQSIFLCEDLESYVVFLLMRFSDKPDILSKVVCLELLDSNYSGPKMRENSLREIGDTCLIFSGLYPGIAKRRNVNNNYYIDMGKTAYGTLYNQKCSSYREVYKLLYQEFTTIINILQSMRDINKDEKYGCLPASNDPII